MGRFSSKSRAGISLALALLVTAAAAQDPVFRTEVRLVRLLVTVKDAQGALVGSLEESDFRVFDNGVEQQIAVFERQTAKPLSIALLIDTSGSTRKELKTELDSIRGFLKALVSEGNPEDAAALFEFNWRTTQHTPFTRNTRRLDAALKQLKPEGGTSLYDAMYLAAGELSEREGRHVMVIVTDGADTTSAKDFQAALRAVQEADTVVYPVVIVPIKSDAGRSVRGENALTTIAQQTGGRLFSPAPGAELSRSFVEILRELRTQYLIGFYPKHPTPQENRFHRVEVRVKNASLRVSTRAGYYDPQ